MRSISPTRCVRRPEFRGGNVTASVNSTFGAAPFGTITNSYDRGFCNFAVKLVF